MRPIPKPLLKRLLADKRNQYCIACGKYGTDNGLYSLTDMFLSVYNRAYNL